MTALALNFSYHNFFSTDMFKNTEYTYAFWAFVLPPFAQ